MKVLATILRSYIGLFVYVIVKQAQTLKQPFFVD